MAKTNITQEHNIHYVENLEGKLKEDDIKEFIPEPAVIDTACLVNEVGKDVPVRLRISLSYKKEDGSTHYLNEARLYYSNMDDVKSLMDDFESMSDNDLIGRSVIAYRLRAGIVGIEKAD